MKRTFVALLVAGLMVWTTGSACAALIDFQVAGAPSSRIEITPDLRVGTFTLTAALAGVSGFGLEDGQSRTFDFFTLTGSGSGLMLADIVATLAFTAPGGTSVTGNADILAGSWRGRLSGGVLVWEDMPQSITLANGNYFDVDFLDLAGFGYGNSATVTATVTAHAGTASVPEPGTMVLLGSGLVGLSCFGRKKFKR